MKNISISKFMKRNEGLRERERERVRKRGIEREQERKRCSMRKCILHFSSVTETHMLVENHINLLNDDDPQTIFPQKCESSQIIFLRHN